jgi:hypothetical protein
MTRKTAIVLAHTLVTLLALGSVALAKPYECDRKCKVKKGCEECKITLCEKKQRSDGTVKEVKVDRRTERNCDGETPGAGGVSPSRLTETKNKLMLQGDGTSGAGERPTPGGSPRRGTIGEDDMAVCCLIELDGRSRKFRTNRGNCRGRNGSVVDLGECPERVHDEAKRLVCCMHYRNTPFKVVRHFELMPNDRCEQQPNGKAVDNDNCVEHTTAGERLLECRKRGEGWVWEDHTCKRASVRDKR